MAANMLYSQNNVALTNKLFWKQSSYFNVSTEDFIFINDKVFTTYITGYNGSNTLAGIKIDNAIKIYK